MEAFVYCWTDHKYNKLYVGSHKGSTDDGYVCSSKTMLEEYKSRPSDFTRQIIAHGKSSDIRILEYKILVSLNAAFDESFYNKHNGFGSYLTDDIKLKIGEKSKKLWKNDEFRKEMSFKRKEIWKNMDPNKKIEMKQKVSISNKKPKTEEQKKAMRGKRPHVNQSGSNNNNSVAIETPYGFFGSIKEAADSLNIKYDNLWYKLRANKPGWRRIIC
jgi:hypothetical protein